MYEIETSVNYNTVVPLDDSKIPGLFRYELDSPNPYYYANNLQDDLSECYVAGPFDYNFRAPCGPGVVSGSNYGLVEIKCLSHTVEKCDSVMKTIDIIEGTYPGWTGD